MLKALTQLASFAFDELTGRYEAFLVESGADRVGAMEVLERVRHQELGRVAGQSVLDTEAFQGASVRDLLFACRDRRTGEIVGVVRGTLATDIMHLEEARQEYAFDRVPRALLEKSYIATRLSFLKEYRGSIATLVLLRRLFQEGLKVGLELCLLTSEPSILSTYQRMGLYAYAPVIPSKSGGFRVPVVLVLHDIEALKATRSPLLKTYKRYARERLQGGLQWIRELKPESIDLGVVRYRPEMGRHSRLTTGMSEQGIQQLFRNAWRVRCKKGQLVIRERDGSRGFFILISGRLRVERQGQVVAHHGPGDLIGELATTLGLRRTANVYAEEAETEVVVLSQRALERVTDPRDIGCLWRNVACAIGQKLMKLEIPETKRRQPATVEDAQ